MTKDKVTSALASMLRGGADFRKLSVQVLGNPRATEAESEAPGENEADSAYHVTCRCTTTYVHTYLQLF